MIEMTKLERVMAYHLGADFQQMDPGVLQTRLDEVTPDIIAEILGMPDSEGIISAHMAAVYNATANEYIRNPHNQGVIGELIAFRVW